MPLAAFLALAAAASADDDASRLRFARHGEPVATRDLAALRALVPSREVRVFEPYEGRELSFRALPLEPVLDAVYGTGWREEEELLFRCRDGYQPTIPVARVRAHRAWLAFERPDRARFSIDKRESGRQREVSLAPFYLVWENLADEALRRDGDYGWPYQLIGLDLIRAHERFPAMAPAADAPAPVRRGFRAFRVHCSRCHPVNGEGGSIGPELNARSEPAGARDPAWLRRWIDDPSQFVATARMPALNPALPEREATIDAIVAYLQALARTQPPAGETRDGG